LERGLRQRQLFSPSLRGHDEATKRAAPQLRAVRPPRQPARFPPGQTECPARVWGHVLSGAPLEQSRVPGSRHTRRGPPSLGSACAQAYGEQSIAPTLIQQNLTLGKSPGSCKVFLCLFI